MPEQHRRRLTQAVLFDLDGTLADTAPDLGAALNRARADESLPPTPLANLRPYTSQGVRGLIRAAYGLTPDHDDYAALAERVLAHYSANICIDSCLFPGMEDLLQTLESRGIAWGIVTNKHTRFTGPLVRAMQLHSRAACIVSGDTTPRAKPAPEPLLYAARECGVAPANCLYLGDDRRDIAAAHAAGMQAIAVSWGYHGSEDPIDTWGADAIIDHPVKVMDWLAPAA